MTYIALCPPEVVESFLRIKVRGILPNCVGISVIHVENSLRDHAFTVSTPPVVGDIHEIGTRDLRLKMDLHYLETRNLTEIFSFRFWTSKISCFKGIAYLATRHDFEIQ